MFQRIVYSESTNNYNRVAMLGDGKRGSVDGLSMARGNHFFKPNHPPLSNGHKLNDYSSTFSS